MQKPLTFPPEGDIIVETLIQYEILKMELSGKEFIVTEILKKIKDSDPNQILWPIN